jgi:hypothetical protein
MTTAAAPEIVQPAHLWVPPRIGSYGDEVVDLARMAGREVDAEQALAIDAMCSYGPGGRWLALEQCIVEARQNGKTNGVLVPITLADMFLWEADELTWTAHLFKTTRKAFNEFVRCIEFSAELSRRVKRVNVSHGEESIELTSGALLQFLARSQGGGRGLSGKRVVFDEALILSASAMGALLPTLSTRPNAQVTYGSSAGNLGSKHLRSLRNRGRADRDPSLVWVEWCDDGSWEDPPCRYGKECSHLYGVEGCALDDEARWARANHTAGKRITFEYIRAERRTLEPREFGRERCGWWEDPPTEDESKAIDAERWASLADPGAPAPTGAVALALDVPSDRSSTAVTVTWHTGVRLMVMLLVLPGTSKAVSKVRALCLEHEVADVSLHAGGPAGSFVAELENDWTDDAGELHDGLNVHTVSTADLAKATGAFLDLIGPPKDDHGNVLPDDKPLGHLGQLELDAAVRVAETRKLGDAKIWNLGDELGNIAPLRAASLSTWGYIRYAGNLPEADIF